MTAETNCNLAPEQDIQPNYDLDKHRNFGKLQRANQSSATWECGQEIYCLVVFTPFSSARWVLGAKAGPEACAAACPHSTY